MLLKAGLWKPSGEILFPDTFVAGAAQPGRWASSEVAEYILWRVPGFALCYSTVVNSKEEVVHNTKPSLALQRALLFYIVLFCGVAFAQDGRGAYVSTTAKTSAWLLAQYPTKEEYLVSPNGRYWLIMGMDGRLGLYEGTSSQDRAKLLWSENGAPGLGNYFLNMQNDGNLAVWSLSRREYRKRFPTAVVDSS